MGLRPLVRLPARCKEGGSHRALLPRGPCPCSSYGTGALMLLSRGPQSSPPWSFPSSQHGSLLPAQDSARAEEAEPQRTGTAAPALGGPRPWCIPRVAGEAVPQGKRLGSVDESRQRKAMRTLICGPFRPAAPGTWCLESMEQKPVGRS